MDQLPAAEKPAPQEQAFRLPGSTLMVRQPEPSFPVSVREWKRLRGRVEDLASPVNYLEGLGWACLGAGGSAILALIVWYPTYAQLTHALQVQFAWVAPGIWIFLIAAFVVAAYSLFINWRLQESVKQDAQEVVAEMDELSAAYEGHARPKTKDS